MLTRHRTCSRRGALRVAAFALLAGSIVAHALAQTAPFDGLVIRNVTVVSPERIAPLEHAYILIRDGKIAEVSGRPLRGREEIDGAGRYLIPGLIDTHVHLSGRPGMVRIAGMTDAQIAAHADIAAAANTQAPRSFLYFGFTTLLDLRGRSDFIAEWNGRPLHPDAYFCGPSPMPNGYSFDSFETSPYFLYDNRQADRIPSSVNPAEHTPEAVVQRMAKDGAICVKTYYEKGFAGANNLPNPSVEMIRAVVAAAHTRHMPVFLHANSEEGQAFALKAGVDVIAHGMWNGHQLVGDQLSDEVAAILDEIAARSVGYQPTAQVMRGIAGQFDRHLLDTPELADVVPASLLAWYATDEGGWFRRELQADIAGGDPGVIYPAIFHRLDRVLQRLDARHARFLFGTDTPGTPSYVNAPGLNEFLEMRDWIAAGISAKTLFTALTLENARAIGLQNQIGSIGPGKIANLLLLRANPLLNVDAYNSIDTVFLHGRPIARETLSARSAHGQ